MEDPLSDSGYRIIDYFPDYQLQPKEQILIEWAVDGVSSVKITGLSGDALKEIVTSDEKVKALVEGQNVVKIIAVPGRLVNFVVK